ncbi:cisplatin damage response ATP-dependent DNA ligase [Robbsia sp. Bb-Pol-6]|uniref:DNA ligase (ATP) n=1 Tax=Robbsia betulipollinis TaxID=2981849 RepID=A0ABT3ZMN6_9BURK|nr:cisplatin damage response ATP-dependent DNA ligase [Robbsia betulipollinis]MCY0387818.1 cisplatin damage response ATP-dependent DNA ligase [Robbsia betulipollinis]
MKAFAQLYTTLDATTSTRDKLDALTAYFRDAPPVDAAWAAYFLAGGKPRRVVPTRAMRELAQAIAGLPEWLFDEAYQAVGDLAETIAHILPPPRTATDIGLAVWMEARLLPLRGAAPEVLAEHLAGYWDELDWSGRFLLSKLIGGGFRVGVSRQLVVRALAEVAGIDHKRVAHRMVGWTDTRRMPTAERFLRLVAGDPAADAAAAAAAAADATATIEVAADTAALPGQAVDPPRNDSAHDPALPLTGDGRDVAHDDDVGLPYPFFLAHALQESPEILGERERWQAEWKWDGIRAQLVRRAGGTWLWSRGEELITDRFPDVIAFAAALPDGIVLDGEILAWESGATAPLPFARLQTRITRKTVGRKILADSPARFMAYDLLEERGEDLRQQPQSVRRERLEALLAPSLTRIATAPPASSLPASSLPDSSLAALQVSPLVEADSWEALARLRAESRARGVEGLMLKRRDAHYGVGRTRAGGEWWKWKVDPYTVDAVLLYAQHGHGRRANLYTDYTFAVWSGPSTDAERTLVPFTKAYSGLTDEEIRQVDAIVRKTTVEKFGPVRSVKPTLLFEIAFEGIARSPRHKSGIAVRFPRMLRWRLDKPLEEADTLDTLAALLDAAA